MHKIRIGTRGSPLALAQAHEVRDRLTVRHGLDNDRFEIAIIKTTGDRIQDKALRDFGGKGLFTKEIEQALIDRRIDMAVHSMKDMPTQLPDGLVIDCLLPREDVRDAFISPRAGSISGLPAGAVVGTASLRRQAQVKRLRPDLKVVTFRGAVETRLAKLANGDVDATLLAYAGIKRLGYEDKVTSVIETDEMLPAVAQGAIGIEVREDDEQTSRLVSPLNDKETEIRILAERLFLARLDGSCRTPIAGLAEIKDGTLTFRGMILSPDGEQCFETQREGSLDDAGAMGDQAALELLERAGPDFLAQMP